jgi:putative copper export protein
VEHQGSLPLDLYALARWIAYSATLVTIGACVGSLLLARFDLTAGQASQAMSGAWDTVRRATLLGPVILIIAHLLRLYGQVTSFLEPGEPITSDGIHAVVAGTTWGHGWTIQLVAALFALGLLGIARARVKSGVHRVIPEAILAALAVAFTSPLTGHAMENPWGRVPGILLHGLHALGAGVWLGTLCVLFLAGFRAIQAGGAFDGTALLARLVRAFSPVALTGAAVAVSAGLLLGVAYVGSFADLWGTLYGRTLLVKTALLVATMALGAYNWKTVTPRLDTTHGASIFRSSAAAELTLGALILAATALLVALPAPRI